MADASAGWSAEDFVIATGRQRASADSSNSPPKHSDGALEWQGQDWMGGRRSTGEVVVRIDPRYFRPAEVETLLGDPARPMRIKLTPTTTLEELVAEMVEVDREEARKEAILRLGGIHV